MKMSLLRKPSNAWPDNDRALTAAGQLCQTAVLVCGLR